MPTADQWLRVRAHLLENRHTFAVKAAAEYPDTPKVANTPLLTAPAWAPRAPIPLADFELPHRPTDFRGVDGTATTGILPAGYRTYSAAMADLAAPTTFQNRPTYRLVEATGSRMVFGNGTYFDGIDVGEACAHEYAARDLGLVDSLRLRTAVGDPCDPSRRPTNVAISTLTLRREGDDAAFYLHWRDPKRVGHAGGMYQVLPVGVFQAATDERNDFSLWRCMIREFAEELLAASEEYATPIDYDAWPFAQCLGQARSWYLGTGVDPLTFATDLLTAVVIDAPLFDELFGDLVSHNDEGRVLEGLPFTEENVGRFVRREPTQAAGAALLALAWEHRSTLLK